MQVRVGGVAGVTDPTEHVPGADGLTHRDRDRSRPQVRETSEDPVGVLKDHVVAEHHWQLRFPERHRVADHPEHLSHRVDPRGLGNAVPHSHDLGVERRVDRRIPRVALARRRADHVQAQRAGRARTQLRAVVHPEEVERVALAEQVGAMARHSVTGRVVRDPVVAAQWEVDDHRFDVAHLTRLGPVPARAGQLSPPLAALAATRSS